MKIGVCASPDKLPLLEELGYDYIEANFGWLATLSDEEFGRHMREMERFSLASEAFNCFFKGDMVLYAQDGNQDALLREIRAYAERGFARASAWGGKIAVIGSGGARKMQEWMTREEADRQFSRVLGVCGEVADKYGMTSWTNCESFDRDMPIRFLPIKWEKMRLKLEAAEKTGVEKAITFEFSHFMSPHSMYSSAHGLFDRYMEYREEVLKRS